ncbi:hypothetical protein H5410_064233 [Solanum commersonii]|uniref:Uncharacterized protein n=1 Tax=Solanum commersonii TaxID=4109 RepID=A0A9J5VZW7_SOLCO|nr:hypothetical protein H5410_064233 [Solanum commersonii]
MSAKTKPLIQNIVEDLEVKDNDAVQVNSKASAANRDLKEEQLSPATPQSIHSTANANGNGIAVASGNTDFMCTKINLLNCPDVHTLHPMPSTGDSTQVNTNVSNIQKKSRHSKQADLEMDCASTVFAFTSEPFSVDRENPKRLTLLELVHQIRSHQTKSYLRYMGRGNYRKRTKQNLTFTIWEEGIIENERTKLLHQFLEYLVILAWHNGVSRYNGVSLTTKFDTTVQIDPPDPQRRELQAWVTEKRQILTSFTLRSTSTSAFLISVPMDEEIVPIASIDSQQDGNYPSLQDIQANISNKLFHFQAKKAFARALRTTSIKLCIHSCVEKQCFGDSLPSPSTINIHEPSKRKQKVEPPHITQEAGSLKMKQKLDPATPKKNN